MRCVQTAALFMQEFDKECLIKDENIIFDERLNGRQYGELEGMSESLIRTKKYLITHPKHSISYMLAQLGFDNAAKIEPKKKYAKKVLDFISCLYARHGNNPGDVIIVTSTSDVYKVLQKDKSLQRYCYSSENPEKSSIPQGDKIECGDFRIVEVNNPKLKNKRKDQGFEDSGLRME